MQPASRGTLLVVATPLGNLGDIAPRAVEALAAADLVAAEDTRRSGLLLAHLGLRKPLIACHKFSEARELARLLAALDEGQTVALVSDGGTPCVSDPGHRLVAAALAAGHRVSPLAGPSAVTAALSAAGFPADSFHVAGFLPSRAGARREAAARLAALPETVVVFEAPHRLVEALADLAAAFGAREATLCRELTKLHEEILRGPLTDLAANLAAREQVLGEIVLVIAGSGGRAPVAAADAGGGAWTLLWRWALEREEDDPRRAMRRLARDLDRPRAAVRAALEAAGALGAGDTE